MISRLDAYCRERFQAKGAAVATRAQIRDAGFPACVFVHGDTSSAAAAAVAAFNLRIPVDHIEAGLRTERSTNSGDELRSSASTFRATRRSRLT